MEVSDTLSGSGVTVVGSDAPSDYHVAPRTASETPPVSAPPPAAVTPPPPASATPPPPPPPAAAAVAGTVTFLKKKRGRPRKYGPDGSVAGALSPKPISSSAPPPVIDFSAVAKRGKVRSTITSAAKVQMPVMEAESMGEWVSCSVGANFTPHIITVNAGEGRFEILSLTGSFMPSETGGMRNRSGGMSVSLASPDGRVVGGGVAGLLVAASPVQIVVGSFLAGNQLEQTTKKQKPDSLAIIPTAAIPISSAGMEDTYHTSPSFRGDSWSSMPQESRNKPTDINVTLPG
ncbi:AT-hook motif nuclear-localized protein 1-like isoform X2 [Salvia splendens]|uniref:AT-hook motif nuclear-localized protein 1-like isoform X2 n=1 Tax=Salvia splendens TaxID=180675 RepID=UPI001C27E2A8|nr:AT-hook motif nuclear-localized protein 1-like isoform X2 [Salvia splendens]